MNSGKDCSGTADNDVKIAVAAIVVATWSLSLGDAIVKMTGTLLPLWQMFILRSLVALLFLGTILYRQKVRVISSPGWIIFRSLLLVLMWLSYYIALPLMPLSLAAAAYYTAPVLIVLIASFCDRKSPLKPVWLAVLCGFCGVLLILRPDGAQFNWIMLLPLLSALLYASAMVLTSRKCKDNNPMVLALILNIVFVLVGCILGMLPSEPDTYLAADWAPLNPKLIAIVVIMGLLNVVGNIGAVIAYQKGPPTTVAVFDYSYVAFGLLWGMLFFAEYPGWLAIVGMLLITIAGILSLFAQRRSSLPD